MATVTIGKTYFEALLRRAEFHTNGSPDHDPLSTNSLITLRQAEHAQLMRQAREYDTLRKALFRGGLTPETLDILISGSDKDPREGDATLTSWGQDAFNRPPPVSVTISKPHGADQLTPDPSETHGGNKALFSSSLRAAFGRSNSFGAADTSITSPDINDQMHDIPGSTPVKAPFAVNDKRTILFTNLSDKTTHRDLTSIIRGGRLLDIYLRNDRSATVSFVEGAAEFLAHAKRNDIYLHTKRVEICWNDRQFRLPPHVAKKIAMGSTRNIVIRNGTSKNLSEGGIRDDLEHIHNLVIISITIDKGDIYISTNSIHNALFARTCMMSRSLYKGLKIEWYPDECANPLHRAQERVPVPKPALQQSNPKGQSRSRQVSNRSNIFSLLDMDGTEESDGSDADDIEAQALPASAFNGVSLNWADSVIVA